MKRYCPFVPYMQKINLFTSASLGGPFRPTQAAYFTQVVRGFGATFSHYILTSSLLQNHSVSPVSGLTPSVRTPLTLVLEWGS